MVWRGSVILFAILLLPLACFLKGQAILVLKKNRINSVQLMKSEIGGRLHANHPRGYVGGGGAKYRRDAGSCGLSPEDVLEMEPVRP